MARCCDAPWCKPRAAVDTADAGRRRPKLHLRVRWAVTGFSLVVTIDAALRTAFRTAASALVAGAARQDAWTI